MQKRVVIFTVLCLFIFAAGVNLYIGGFQSLLEGFSRTFEGGNEVISLLNEDTPQQTLPFQVELPPGEEVGSITAAVQMGDLRLVPAPDGVLAATGTLTVYGQTQEDADGYADQVAVEFVPAAGGQELKVVEKSPRPAGISGVRADLVLHVPEGLSVEAITGLGNIEAVDLTGPLTVEGNYGQIDVVNIGEDVTLKGNHSAIKAQGIGGNLVARPRYEELSVQDINGSLHLNGAHTEVVVAGVGGNAQVEGRFITGQVREVGGQLEFNLEHSTLRFSEIAQRIVGRGQHSRVTLLEPAADLGLEGAFTTFDLRLSEPDFQLQGQGEFTQIISDFPLEVTEEGPRKTFTYQQGNGKHSYWVNSRHGEIELISLP